MLGAGSRHKHGSGSTSAECVRACVCACLRASQHLLSTCGPESSTCGDKTRSSTQKADAEQRTESTGGALFTVSAGLEGGEMFGVSELYFENNAHCFKNA